MRFTASKERHKLNRAAVNLSSMIDVTFLLLVYFIVTTVPSRPSSGAIVPMTPSASVER